MPTKDSALLYQKSLTGMILSSFKGLQKKDLRSGTHKFISHFESITKVRLLPFHTHIDTHTHTEPCHGYIEKDKTEPFPIPTD